MKKIIFLLFTGLMALSSSAQIYTFRGTITYYTELIKIAKGGGTDGGYNWMVDIDEKQIIKGVFNVAFSSPVSGVTNYSSGYQLFEIQENFDITVTSNNEAHEERVSQSCSGEYNKPKDSWGKPNVIIISPGDSYSAGSATNASRIDPGKPVITGGRIMIRGNEFNLILTGELKLRIESESYSKQNLVCLPESPPAKSISDTQEMEWPIIVSGKGTLDNPEIISGFLLPRDISNDDCRNCTGSYASFVHGDLECVYLDKISISWELTRRCEALSKVGDELDKRKDISNSQKNRIKDVLNRLADTSIDPYVLFSSGADNVLSINTEEQADIILNNKEKYMQDLRKAFNKECELARSIEELTNQIIRRDTWVVQFINRFNRDYLSEHRLSPGEVKIKDWIADQQRNPNSIYSCYAGD